MNEQGKFVSVATKVSTWVWARLNAIADKKGMSLYEMAQMVYDTLVRYMDDQHNLSAEMEQAMSIFDHMVGWKGQMNLATPNGEKAVTEATYYVGAEGKEGVRAVHVSTPFMGEAVETVNVQEILERTICLLMPQRYMRLRRLAVDMDCNSILQLIDTLIDENSKEADVKELRQGFEDANRSEFGRKPWEQPFKRHHHRTPDSVAQAKQGRIEFTPEDYIDDDSRY